MYILPLKDTFHTILSSSIWPFIYQSLPHNISEPIKWIYQICGYLRIKESKEFVKTGIWEKKRSPTCCSYTGEAPGPELLCFLHDSPPHTMKAGDISACPLHTCFLCIRIHFRSTLSYLLTYVVPAALLHCSIIFSPSLLSGLLSLSSYRLTSTTEEEKLCISCTLVRPLQSGAA